MTSASSAESTALSLRSWLAAGRPQSASGAFFAWWDSEADKPAFEYPEITGYVLTHFAGLDDASADEVDAGRLAGKWLVGRVDSGNLAARDGWDGGAVYNFDLAMMSNGLVTFGTRFDEPAMTEAGVKLAATLSYQVVGTGELSALPVGTTSTRSTWSSDGLALMIKAAQCLLTAGSASGDRVLDESAGTVAGMARRIQQHDGRIVTHPADFETMCHPHLYAVEGLWVHAQATGNAESLDRARAGAEWVAQYQLESGGFPRYVSTVSDEVGPEQMDVTAQALRAMTLTGTGSAAGRDAAAARIVEVAKPAAGGQALPYQPDGPAHQNVWVTLFAAQALKLHASAIASTGVLTDWRSIV